MVLVLVVLGVLIKRCRVVGRRRGLHWHHQSQQPPLHSRVKLQLQLQLQLQKEAAAGRWSSSAYACRMTPPRREQMPSVGGWARIAYPSITKIGWLSSGKQSSAVFVAAAGNGFDIYIQSLIHVDILCILRLLIHSFCVTKVFYRSKECRR